MKNKFIAMMSTLFFVLFSFAAFAFDVPPAPSNGGYVVDQSGRLSASDIQTINNKIENINKSTKNEIGVLMIKSVGDETIDDIAYKTFNTWGVGKKGLDNGVLIVIAVESKKARIETGKGITGEITDLQAHDIIMGKMKPQFRAGNMLGCVVDSVDAIGSLLESRKNQAVSPSTKASSSEDGFGIFLLVLLGLGGIVGLAVWLINRGEKKRESNGYYYNTNSYVPPTHHNYNDDNTNVANAATGALVGGAVGLAAGAIYESEHRKHVKKEESSYTPSYTPSYTSSNDSDSSSSNNSSSDWSSGGSGFDSGGFSGGGGSSGDL